MSRTTVSLVLADNPRIPDRTKARVREVMAGLGYVYNRAATAVRAGQSSLLGLLLTDIRNPFFAEVTMAVDRAADDKGTSAILGFSFGSSARESQIALSFVEHFVGGLILLPTPESRADGLACLLGPGAFPLVQMLREVRDVPSDFVGVDNVGSGRLLGGHLHSCGVESVVFVGGAPSRQFDDRLLGLSQGLPAGAVRPVMGGVEGLARAWGVSRPQCVVTYNDTHLLAVMNLLRDKGVEPGRDVALASFDNTPVSQQLHPAVTSIDHHASELASRAVGMLAARSRDASLPWQRSMVPGTLQVRASTAL